MGFFENQLIKCNSFLAVKLGLLHRGARKMITAFEQKESEFRTESRKSINERNTRTRLNPRRRSGQGYNTEKHRINLQVK